MRGRFREWKEAAASHQIVGCVLPLVVCGILVVKFSKTLRDAVSCIARLLFLFLPVPTFLCKK